MVASQGLMDRTLEAGWSLRQQYALAASQDSPGGTAITHEEAVGLQTAFETRLWPELVTVGTTWEFVRSALNGANGVRTTRMRKWMRAFVRGCPVEVE